MKHLVLLLSATVLATPAAARDTPDPARLKASVEKLVSFGTRHSLSSATDPKRGIGAARKWAGDEFARIGKACGNCLTIESVEKHFTGPRAPNGVNIVDVLAIQPGSEPNRVIIIQGHIDSRVSDPLDATSDAPGANDDASGVALVIETARILSKEKFRATIVYAALSGEEQGLWGGQLLAETARARGWQVTAVLNNDIVGNTIGQNGAKVDTVVRVFSEGIRAGEDLPGQIARRGNGGEDDGPSRALARTVDAVAATIPGGLDVFVNRRPDRFGRGGDHEPFLRMGYPAVRFTVGAENWQWQHQDLRTENGVVYGDTIDRMDFAYLAKVTAINVAAIVRLASAPAAPEGVTLGGAGTTNTDVKWAAVPGAAKYRVHIRRNDARDWQRTLEVAGDQTGTSLKDVIVDDVFVGVSSVAEGGAESVVTFGGRAPPRR